MNKKINYLVPCSYFLIATAWPLAVQAQTTDWDASTKASLEQMATNLELTLTPWQVPDHIFRVEDYGAKADGGTINTSALQKAIDDCSAAGGGVVQLSKGDYVSGKLFLKSGVMLEIDKDAKLLGSTNLSDYPQGNGKGKEALLCAEGAERIGIRGAGVIDGRGEIQNFPGDLKSMKADSHKAPPTIAKRPLLICFIACHKIVIDGISIRSSASWMENYLSCDDLIIQGLHVENIANWNNDGIDIDGCHNVIVRNSVVNAEDDGMCFKEETTRTMDNVLVENCKFYSTCNALKLGTASRGTFQNVLIRDVEVGGPAANMPMFHGWRTQRTRAEGGISWEVVDGGTIENVMVERAKIVRTISPFFLRLGDRGQHKPDDQKLPPGKLQHVIFEDITGTDNNGSTGSIISGIPGFKVENVVFRNINLAVQGGGTAQDINALPPEKIDAYPNPNMFGEQVPAYGFWLRHADNVTFDKVHVSLSSPDARPAFAAGEDSANIVVNGKPLKSP